MDLRKLRRHLDLTQVDVAEEVGCTPSEISRIERGLVIPRCNLRDALIQWARRRGHRATFREPR